MRPRPSRANRGNQVENFGIQHGVVLAGLTKNPPQHTSLRKPGVNHARQACLGAGACIEGPAAWALLSELSTLAALSTSIGELDFPLLPTLRSRRTATPCCCLMLWLPKTYVGLVDVRR